MFTLPATQVSSLANGKALGKRSRLDDRRAGRGPYAGKTLPRRDSDGRLYKCRRLTVEVPPRQPVVASSPEGPPPLYSPPPILPLNGKADEDAPDYEVVGDVKERSSTDDNESEPGEDEVEDSCSDVVSAGESEQESVAPLVR